MSSSFNLTIINPEKIIYQGTVSSLVASCQEGYLGVLANHAPLVAALAKGKIILRESSGEPLIFYSQGEGFLEVLDNNVTLILGAAITETKDN